MFPSLSGKAKFKYIWKEASVCYGLVSKWEELVNEINVDDSILKNLSATED